MRIGIFRTLGKITRYHRKRADRSREENRNGTASYAVKMFHANLWEILCGKLQGLEEEKLLWSGCFCGKLFKLVHYKGNTKNMNAPYLSIVIPAYNEETNIRSERLRRYPDT